MASKALKKKLEAKRKELADRSAGGQFLIIKEGVTRVRHLPVGDENEYVVEATTFYLGDKIKGVISPRTVNKKCAIMETYEKLSSSKKAEDRELAAKFKPQKKYFSPVIKYKDEKGKEIDTETGVKMLQMTNGLYQDTLDLFLDDEQGDFTDPKAGYDLKYKRTGKTKTDTEYNVTPCKPTPLSKKYAGKLYDPVELFKAMLPTYEETKQKIEEFLSGATIEEEEERPRKKKKVSTLKKKKKSRDL